MGGAREVQFQPASLPFAPNDQHLPFFRVYSTTSVSLRDHRRIPKLSTSFSNSDGFLFDSHHHLLPVPSPSPLVPPPSPPPPSTPHPTQPPSHLLRDSPLLLLIIIFLVRVHDHRFDSSPLRLPLNLNDVHRSIHTHCRRPARSYQGWTRDYYYKRLEG